ncbi:MAG: hypothetical protein A2176_11810 [Spirochaetes bacterium RBG_13_51_14]|nr:MAG: hypothetical protein A2176_11810 [Spirochaetes bacterium RBG_13_51_14]
MRHILIVIPLLFRAVGYMPETSFSVIITIYAGTARALWTYSLDTESISVTRHSANGDPDRIVERRALTLKEIKKLDKYFTLFPLQRLAKQYVNEKIHGDTCSRYFVRINREEKQTYVCYARPEELLDLNRVINRLLPRQYRLWDEARED